MSDANVNETATTVASVVEKQNDLFSQGDLFYWTCEYEKAKEHFQLLLEQPLLSLLDSARCYNSLGAANTKLQNYEEAISNYRKQGDILIQLKIPNKTEGDIAKCYMSIGMVYWLKHEYAQALDCHQQALVALAPIAPAPDLTSKIYKNLANLHTKTNEFDTALEYFEKALEIDRQHLREDHLKFGQTYANIGAMYNSKQDYKEALKYFVNARETWLKSLPSSRAYIESMDKTIRTVQSKLEFIRMPEPRLNKQLYMDISRLKLLSKDEAPAKFILEKSPFSGDEDDLATAAREEYTITGRIFPNSDLFREGSFRIEIRLTKNFPSDPPEVRFLTPIYHPNVTEDGRLCHALLKKTGQWTPRTSLVDIIQVVVDQIDHPDIDYALNLEMAREYMENRPEFNRKAIESIRKNALPRD